MSDSPEEIRAEIERTRLNLGQDVDALADKVTPSKIAARQTDKMRAGLSGIRDRVMGAAHDGASTTSGALSDAGSSVSDAAHGVKAKAEGNPLAVGLIALGAGLLIASLFPASQKEQELAATVKEQGPAPRRAGRRRRQGGRRRPEAAGAGRRRLGHRHREGRRSERARRSRQRRGRRHRPRPGGARERQRQLIHRAGPAPADARRGGSDPAPLPLKEGIPMSPSPSSTVSPRRRPRRQARLPHRPRQALVELRLQEDPSRVHLRSVPGHRRRPDLLRRPLDLPRPRRDLLPARSVRAERRRRRHRPRHRVRRGTRRGRGSARSGRAALAVAPAPDWPS